MELFLCYGHEDYHGLLHMCWCAWVEIWGYNVILLFSQGTSRKMQWLQSKAMWVDPKKGMYLDLLVCLCLGTLLFPHIYPAFHRVLHGEFQSSLGNASYGHRVAALKQQQQVSGELTLLVCLQAPSMCIELKGRWRRREFVQPELACWVMNLLLRHSLKHNYIHQSYEGLFRPLNLS